jgi:hypothetical protein
MTSGYDFKKCVHWAKRAMLEVSEYLTSKYTTDT